VLFEANCTKQKLQFAAKKRKKVESPKGERGGGSGCLLREKKNAPQSLEIRKEVTAHLGQLDNKRTNKNKFKEKTDKELSQKRHERKDERRH